MSVSPTHVSLKIAPESRFAAIDVLNAARTEFGEIFDPYRRVVYCSHHTTAGYLEPAVALRLANRKERVTPFVESYRSLFPENAGYQHDEMNLRTELSDEQRLIEPPNADAHLTFIGAGLQSCVTYDHHPDRPVYLFELDGVYEGRRRERTTTLVGYNADEVIRKETVTIPVTHHAMDSVNLADPRLGLLEQIKDRVAQEGIDHGRVDIALGDGENASAVTINEYETLLMRHDLREVLKDPMKFFFEQGRRALQDPRAVPAKSRGYAKYDVVHVMNLLMDAFGLSESAVERLVARLMGYPAQRMLRFKRSVSMAVTRDEGGQPKLIRGRYQSPILIQWRPSERRQRKLEVSFTRFH